MILTPIANARSLSRIWDYFLDAGATEKNPPPL
jgi:hypothetical protein